MFGRKESKHKRQRTRSAIVVAETLDSAKNKFDYLFTQRHLSDELNALNSLPIERQQDLIFKIVMHSNKTLTCDNLDNYLSDIPEGSPFIDLLREAIRVNDQLQACTRSSNKFGFITNQADIKLWEKFPSLIENQNPSDLARDIIVDIPLFSFSYKDREEKFKQLKSKLPEHLGRFSSLLLDFLNIRIDLMLLERGYTNAISYLVGEGPKKYGVFYEQSIAFLALKLNLDLTKIKKNCKKAMKVSCKQQESIKDAGEGFIRKIDEAIKINNKPQSSASFSSALFSSGGFKRQPSEDGRLLSTSCPGRL